MALGLATPFIGIASVKLFRVIDYEIYPRVIQSIFIAGLALFIAGILVKNYWKGGQTESQNNPFDMWSNAGAFAQEKSFDWTGIGCSLLVLGPGLFFIVGMLFAREFPYAPFVGFGFFVVCLIVGNKLYRIGKESRVAQVQAETLAQSPFATQNLFPYSTSTPVNQVAANAIESPPASDTNLPQIIPGRRPEGFVLVDHSEATGCGVTFSASSRRSGMALLC